jgi:hypothetical protein
MQDKTQIKLKYNDSDDDEIVVNNNEDLLEAYNNLFMNKFIKFFVYYNGSEINCLFTLNRKESRNGNLLFHPETQTPFE